MNLIELIHIKDSVAPSFWHADEKFLYETYRAPPISIDVLLPDARDMLPIYGIVWGCPIGLLNEWFGYFNISEVKLDLVSQ